MTQPLQRTTAEALPSRAFATPRPMRTALKASLRQAARGNQRFQPLPPPTGKPPFRLSLDQVLPAPAIAAIQKAKRLVFHVAGDTGGVKTPASQQIVADHMEQDFQAPVTTQRPSFFYHLGDVVYYYGEGTEYFPQFYDPYSHYPAPIFAIPGNHDGDVQVPTVTSLAAFMRNFCAPTPQVSPDAGEDSRQAMTQPNCYWTLETPLATIVGLYTNVPEGGSLLKDQLDWFASELKAAPKNKALLVAAHHPAYSLDNYHSGSTKLGQVLDAAVQKAGRVPDAVLAGHVHNYQRFTRTVKGRKVPYLVVGAGGYWHLHNMQSDQGHSITTPFPVPGSDVTLESYCDDRHGYLRLEVTPKALTGDYFSVPRPHESWSKPAQRVDSFTVPLGH